MATKITAPNDWDLELRKAVKLVLAESCPWYVTERQRQTIYVQIMRRVATVLPTGSGGPGEERTAKPLGSGGPGEERQ